MKTFINIITLVFAVTFAALASQDFINSINATSDGEKITLRWSTIDENNLKTFEIERSAGKGIFNNIGDVDAKGYPASYEFVDDNELMKPGNHDNDVANQNQYSYRIKILKKDNTFDYSNVVNVTHNTSSIRKTWGMIKEMFR